MFIALLIISFLVALATSWIAERLLRGPIQQILEKILGEEASKSFGQFASFGIYIMGVSWGVPLRNLEGYIITRSTATPILDLDWVRWVFEIYRTVVWTLQGVASLILVFSIFSITGYAIVRGVELRRKVVD